MVESIVKKLSCGKSVEVPVLSIFALQNSNAEYIPWIAPFIRIFRIASYRNCRTLSNTGVYGINRAEGVSNNLMVGKCTGRATVKIRQYLFIMSIVVIKNIIIITYGWNVASSQVAAAGSKVWIEPRRVLASLPVRPLFARLAMVYPEEALQKLCKKQRISGA